MSTDLALVATVALRTDNVGDTCPAWIETVGRKCGKPQTDGLLCARHHKIALRRLAAELDGKVARAALRLTWRGAEEVRKRARLVEVEDELKRLDQPAFRDGAAFAGDMHPTLRRQKLSALSDAHVERLAALTREARDLRSWLGSP